MDLINLTTWVVLAAVIGGAIGILKRGIKLDARWWKDGVLPVLPLLLGACIGGLWDNILKGPLAWRILQGVAAGLAAGWVYDRWRDTIRRRG